MTSRLEHLDAKIDAKNVNAFRENVKAIINTKANKE